jgi:hypothetical protein
VADLEFASFSFSPTSPGVAQSQLAFQVQAGQVIVAAFLWVDRPSDNGSSGVISVGGDASTMFSCSIAPEGSTYGPGLLHGASVLAGSDTVRLCQAGENVSMVWTPGGGPGSTSPVLRLAILTQQVF